MNRIICLGSRLHGADRAGPLVHDILTRRPGPPSDVELIDGGLAGLDLLRFVEGADRVIFVDSVVGFGHPDEVVLLDAAAVVRAAGGRFDHAAGLPYLLAAIPAVCDGPAPELRVVGIEGQASDRTLERAARTALELARGLTAAPAESAA